MAQATKTKPKTSAVTAAAKATPKNLGSKGKAKPAKAAEAAAKPARPANVLAVGAFAKFNGYRSQLDASEVVFQEGDTLYIIEVEDDAETGVLYSAINANDIEKYEQEGEDAVTGGQVAPAEVTELKASALDRAKEQFLPVALIGKLATLFEKNDNAIEVAIELNNQVNENYFYLGGALARIIQAGSYLKENDGDYTGENALNDFCNAEFGFKASKAQQLARVYRTFSAIPNFDPSKLDAVGWSKAAIAERFVTDENVDAIIELAENTSQKDLAIVLKDKYVKENTTASGKSASRGATILKTTLTFKLEEDAAETVKLVLQSAMKQTGIESEAAVLERICLEWANDHVEADSAKKRIQSKAAKIEKARAAAAKPPVEKPAAKPTAAPAKAAAPAAKPAPRKKAA